MKILMLADVFFPDTIGGAGRMAYHLSFGLSKKGHEVHVITRNIDKRLPFYQTFNTNMIVHRFSTSSAESFKFFLSEIKNSAFLCKRLLKQTKFDMACIHQSLVTVGPLLSGCLRHIPIVYNFYSPWHEEFLIKRQGTNGKIGKKIKGIAFIMKWIEKQMMSRAAKTLIMSQYMYNKARAIHRYPENKVVKIPGGVDIERFVLPSGGKTIAKQQCGLPQNKTIFLTVRNLVPRMGIETLIETFYRSEILKKKVQLMIGGSGPLEDHLKTLVDNYNLQEVVRFLGYIADDELPQLYQAADFFVLPTKELEGFGLVILEAMACGTPVLGTPVGSISEVITPFDGRLIFHSSSWKDMKQKLEEVIEKPDEYSFNPKSCRKFVEDTFSWKHVADRFEEEAMELAK